MPTQNHHRRHPAIRPAAPIIIPGEILPNIASDARNDPLMLLAIIETWPKFEAAIDALADEQDDGVIIEDFVTAWQLLMQLSAFGVKFDDAFLARFDELREQIRNTDADTDRDDADFLIDLDDSDEDRCVTDGLEYDECTAGNGITPVAPFEDYGDEDVGARDSTCVK
jgi:hypothetical protein